MITCCVVWVSACVQMCDTCLSLNEVIRGNYNATVSSASFGSGSCCMRRWRGCSVLFGIFFCCCCCCIWYFNCYSKHHVNPLKQQTELHRQQAIQSKNWTTCPTSQSAHLASSFCCNPRPLKSGEKTWMLVIYNLWIRAQLMSNGPHLAREWQKFGPPIYLFIS